MTADSAKEAKARQKAVAKAQKEAAKQQAATAKEQAKLAKTQAKASRGYVAPKARTLPAVFAGILFLLVPAAHLCYAFFNFVGIYGMDFLQKASELGIFAQVFGLTSILIFYALPILGAIASFRRGKGFLATVSFLFACAWGLNLYIGIVRAYQLGWNVQSAFWALAWFILFIVCLVGRKRPLVGARSVPGILGLVATAACAVQWIFVVNSVDLVLVNQSSFMVGAFLELTANLIMAIVCFLVGAAVGRTTKSQEKKAAKAGTATKATAPAASASSSSAASAASNAGSATAGPRVSFDPDYQPTLSAKGDPFAGALAAMDAADSGIKLELTPAVDTSSAASVPSAAARQMKDLQDLLDEGILTRDEFEASKKRLMG